MKTTKDILLRDILPPNLQSDSAVAKVAEAIDPHLNLIASTVRLAYVYSRIDELSGEQLDHLAVQFHVAVWNSLWSKEKKLTVIKATIETKRRRGTLLAVKEAIGSIVSPFEITEWWQQEPKAEPYTFGVTIPLDDIGKDLTSEEQEELFDLIYEAKSIRSHGTVTLKRCFETPVEIAGVFQSCTYQRLIGQAPPITTKIRIPTGGQSAVYSRLTSQSKPISSGVRVHSNANSVVYVRL